MQQDRTHRSAAGPGAHHGRDPRAGRNGGYYSARVHDRLHHSVSSPSRRREDDRLARVTLGSRAAGHGRLERGGDAFVARGNARAVVVTLWEVIVIWALGASVGVTFAALIALAIIFWVSRKLD